MPLRRGIAPQRRTKIVGQVAEGKDRNWKYKSC
jgi:hypothetical protein